MSHESPGLEPTPTWRLIDLTDVRDERGLLTAAEVGRELPFVPRRLFCLRDVGPGQTRGGHALRRASELVVMLAGSAVLDLDDGRQQTAHIALNDRDRPSRGLLIRPMTWVVLHDFSPGAVCLVVADELYQPDAFIGNYAEFQAARR